MINVLEQERGRAWTYTERRDYVSALDSINMLAKQREGARDNVAYTVDTVAENDAKDYSNADETVRALRGAEAEGQPYVIRIEHLPNGRKSASASGQTIYTEEGDVREYDKYVRDNDKALRWVYVDALRPKQECTARPVLASRDGLAAKLEAARNDLAHFGQTPAYQRVQAFGQLTRWEALECHPELDGVCKQFHDTGQSWTPQTSQDQREISYPNAHTKLPEQLYRGRVPEEGVTMDESWHMIDMVTSHRDLMTLDAREFKQSVKDEVMATSSHHALVEISDMIAVRYEEEGLDQDVRVGEKVMTQHDNEKSQVYGQGKEPAWENTRDVGQDTGQ